MGGQGERQAERRERETERKNQPDSRYSSTPNWARPKNEDLLDIPSPGIF